jgi:hypothetical protein
MQENLTLQEKLLEKDIIEQSSRHQLKEAMAEVNAVTEENKRAVEQLQALENSTVYLKKQLTSTLDEHQKVLKELR